MKIKIINDNRITSSLHGVVGTVTKERAANYHVDALGRKLNRYGDPKLFWIQFDEQQRGAGSVMTGVWLQESMFLKENV